jgi:hypothetical protein
MFSGASEEACLASASESGWEGGPGGYRCPSCIADDRRDAELREDWITLERGDDWGHTYFALRALENGTASSKRGLKLEAGQTVRVMWPDGSISEEEIGFRLETQSVSDMGRRYEVNDWVPFLATMKRGAAVEVELDAVRVERKWAERQSGAVDKKARGR